MAEAKAAGVNLLSQELPVGNDRWVEDKTSGSTGAPLAHRRSNLTDLASRCQTQRDLDWWEMDFDQTLALIGDMGHGKADPPDGTTLRAWNMRGSGSFIALDLRASLQQQIDWLQRKTTSPVRIRSCHIPNVLIANCCRERFSSVISDARSGARLSSLSATAFLTHAEMMIGPVSLLHGKRQHGIVDGNSEDARPQKSRPRWRDPSTITRCPSYGKTLGFILRSAGLVCASRQLTALRRDPRSHPKRSPNALIGCGND